MCCFQNLSATHLPIHSTPFFPLSLANFVNSCASQAGIGSKESSNRVHSPSGCAFSRGNICAAFNTCLSPACLSILPVHLPVHLTNIVNSCASQASIGSKESPNRVHPSGCAFQEAAFALLSKSVCQPLAYLSYPFLAIICASVYGFLLVFIFHAM